MSKLWQPDLSKAIRESLAGISKYGSFSPKVGLILGSGLGGFADHLENPTVIPYGDIPHFPVSTVKGHAGTLVVGTLHGVQCVAMKGRTHLYEGHSARETSFPVRVMAQMGVQTFVITNAAGGLNPDWPPGTLMLISDHINFQKDNPLVGPNDETLGARFPDMSDAYSQELREQVQDVAKQKGIELREGVYLAVTGPSYETAAEIRMFAKLGADAVGMSTVPETIVANHMQRKVIGISCITNLGTGLSDSPLHHGEVTETAARVRAQFQELLSGIIEAI